MESKTNYTLVGLFVVILAAIIVVIAFWLSVGLQRQAYVTYLAYMHESVAGLSKQAEVKYNGVSVGYVSDIRLNINNPQQVILTLKIKPDTPVTVSTEAILTEQGITGLAYIGLRSGKDTAPLKKKPSEEYAVIKTTPSFMLRLDQALQNLTGNMGKLSDSVKELLNKQNLNAIKGTLAHLDKITGTIAGNSAELDKSMKSMKVVLYNSEQASKQFPQLVQSVNASATALKKMALNISKTANKGNLAIQTFSDQVMPEVYQTLQNLRNLSQKLEDFTGELQQNPSMLIRGKQAQKPGPGE